MNNSNFAYDCCINLDNCQFIPIFDELKDVMYLKRCYNYFGQKVSKFVTADSIKQETDEKYNDSIMKVERAESMEAAEKYKKKKKKKKTLYDYVERHEDACTHAEMIKLKVWLILMKSIQVVLNH